MRGKATVWNLAFKNNASLLAKVLPSHRKHEGMVVQGQNKAKSGCQCIIDIRGSSRQILPIQTSWNGLPNSVVLSMEDKLAACHDIVYVLFSFVLSHFKVINY
jgi:hypothetical protein